MFQSSTPIIDFDTYAGIELPPGEPVTIRISPRSSNTTVGDMDDRGRRPGPMALATGGASGSYARAKSVNSLLSRKPAAQRWVPNGASTVAVMETALPSLSMIDKCVVPDASSVVSLPQRYATGSPRNTLPGSP